MQPAFYVTWFWKLLDTKYEMSGELACFPLKIIANGFFFHFYSQRWEYFLMWNYAIIIPPGALQKNKLIFAIAEYKSILCLLWNSFCLLVGDILHGWEPDRPVLNAGILWTGKEK